MEVKTVSFVDCVECSVKTGGVKLKKESKVGLNTCYFMDNPSVNTKDKLWTKVCSSMRHRPLLQSQVSIISPFIQEKPPSSSVLNQNTNIHLPNCDGHLGGWALTCYHRGILL